MKLFIFDLLKATVVSLLVTLVLIFTPLIFLTPFTLLLIPVVYPLYKLHNRQQAEKIKKGFKKPKSNTSKTFLLDFIEGCFVGIIPSIVFFLFPFMWITIPFIVLSCGVAWPFVKLIKNKQSQDDEKRSIRIIRKAVGIKNR